MDLLDSILNSMQKPPIASEAQRDAMRKQKEAMEKKQYEEKSMLNKFRKRIEDKISQFLKDETKPYLQFEPMDHVYRAIIHDVAETAGAIVFSFGQDGVDRYPVVYTKDSLPSEDELTVRRAGSVWDKDKAKDMAEKRKEMKLQAAQEAEDDNPKKRKRKEEELSGTFYKAKYAHLIGENAAIAAAKKTNMNKNYGEVPSENKKDLRSIEQTMADIKAKKMKRDIDKETENYQT